MKKIPLTQGMFALVDDESFESLSRHKWCASKQRTHGRFYATRNGPRPLRGTIFMHVVINGRGTDHVNGDGLDNRRSNLRAATDAQNQHNQTRKRRQCSSRYRGVSRVRGKWHASIKIGGKQLFLGSFESEREAAGAYDAAGIARDPGFFTPNFSASWLAPGASPLALLT